MFDLDGTLVHTAPALNKAGNDLLLELNLPPVSIDDYSGFIGGGIPKQVKKLLEFSNHDFTKSLDEYIKRFKEIYYNDPLYKTILFPDVKKVLKELTLKYNNLALCTQKNEIPAKIILKNFDILKYFSDFAFGDSLDVLKPDPRMVHHATKNFISDKVIYIGDSSTDLKTARNSKATFILFTEGYRKKSVKEINPDYYFSNFLELPSIIRDLEINW